MAQNTLLYLTDAQLKELLVMEEVIDALQDAFIQLSEQTAVVPIRSRIEIEDTNTTALFMPVYLPQSGLVGCKNVMINELNIERSMPLIHAIMVVLDAETGSPRAILDAEYLTAVRTGAASGLATRLLSREDSEVAAIIGTGIQGRAQLRAVATVRSIKRVLALDKYRQNAELFRQEMEETLQIPVEVIESTERLQEADIICTATSSYSPVFKDKNIRQGAHINAVGAFKPTMREISSETVARAKIYVDSKDACLVEAGDLIIPINLDYIKAQSIVGEIGQVASGKKPGRQSADEITLFKTVGSAVQDLAAAQTAMRKATEMHTGISIEH